MKNLINEKPGEYWFFMCTRTQDILEVVKADSEKSAFEKFVNVHFKPDKNYACTKVLEYDKKQKCWRFVMKIFEYNTILTYPEFERVEMNFNEFIQKEFNNAKS